MTSFGGLHFPKGSSIGEEELYRYTNGHFLINEERQCQLRHVKFDIPRLCDLASIAGASESPIIAIDKMEGGFCKALEMKKADGTEVVAKLPSKLAGPPRYSTASEVATMKYGKSVVAGGRILYTAKLSAADTFHAFPQFENIRRFPVPRVLAWSSDASNEVGSEYIIMEKAPGVQLYKKWGKMSGTDKIALTRHLVQLEGQLAAVQFPASGSLYFRDTVKDSTEHRPLSAEIDPSQSYCIGPSVDRSWGIQEDMDAPVHEYSRDPWLSVSDYGFALARREAFRIRRVQRTGTRPYRRSTADEEIGDLNTAMKVMECLESNHPGLASISRPILWHTDMHLGNIYVSEDDPTNIISIIDWQSVCVGPLFLQATWPEFLKPSDEYIGGPARPQLPDNFDHLDEADKKVATITRDDALITKSYELRSSLQSPDIYRSLNFPSVFREFFIRCGEAKEEGTVGLRACLGELVQSWNALGFTGDCCISLSKEQLQRDKQQFQEYRYWHDVQELARSYLDTDADGWISPEFDIAEVRQRNKTAFDRYMKGASTQMPASNARKMWPFLEGIEHQ